MQGWIHLMWLWTTLENMWWGAVIPAATSVGSQAKIDVEKWKYHNVITILETENHDFENWMLSIFWNHRLDNLNFEHWELPRLRFPVFTICEIFLCQQTVEKWDNLHVENHAIENWIHSVYWKCRLENFDREHWKISRFRIPVVMTDQIYLCPSRCWKKKIYQYRCIPPWGFIIRARARAQTLTDCKWRAAARGYSPSACHAPPSRVVVFCSFWYKYVACSGSFKLFVPQRGFAKPW